jgi:tRNA/rRNA methyltransferase
MIENTRIVLHRPRDVVNIGGVVRAMKNMGFRRLRLVAPAPFDANSIGGIAHRSEDILAAGETFADLDAALADAIYVVGTSGRPLAGRPVREDVRALAPELLARAQQGPLALLFGPEGNGLEHPELDRCNLVLRLPCDPAYRSLNLAQAALLVMYELRMAAVPPAPPATNPPASAGELAQCFDLAERALESIGFFKSDNRSQVLRRLRALLLRTQPTPRETALLAAIAREIIKQNMQ